MKSASKELLQLEAKCSTSSIESSLRILDGKSSASHIMQTRKEGPLTGPVPKSQVLGKVQGFLGVISEANKKLQLEAKENPAGFDIEALNGDESQIIEMDLMLGIADLNTPEAVAAAESAVAAGCGVQLPHNIPLFHQSDDDTDSSDSSEEEDSDDDDDDKNRCKDDQARFSAQEAVEKPKSCGKPDDDGSGEKIGKKQSKKRSRIVELS